MPRVFVQLPEKWGPSHVPTAFRQGFHAFVSQRGNSLIDSVILFEPNHERAIALRNMWQGWRNLTILEGEVGEIADGKTTYYFADEDLPVGENGFQDPWPVLQRFPSGHLHHREIPQFSLTSVIREIGSTGVVTLASIDLRRIRRSGSSIDLQSLVNYLTSNPGKSWPSVIHCSTTGLRSDEVDRFARQLRAYGYMNAGRVWGEARTGITFVLPRNLLDRIASIKGRVRVLAGRAVVWGRDSVATSKQREEMKLRIAAALPGGVSRSDFIDDQLASPLSPAPVVQLHHVLPQGEEDLIRRWEFAIDEGDPRELAAECRDRHGVLPVSFSFPKPLMAINPDPQWLISPITPGLPYTFTNEQAYLDSYNRAYLGITHRKAGWDCFRHVEVMASGAVPLMPDAEDIPKYSMIHYPKKSLAKVSENIMRFGCAPSDAMRHRFREYFLEHLTSRAMAEYVLTSVGLQDVSSILFVDERLPHHNDYQSVLTLIGLKQMLGVNCHVMFPTEYVYEDSHYPVETLYGRGFGYTKVLSAGARSVTEKKPPSDLSAFDALVVGSITRNEDLAKRLLHDFPAERTIWIHGEDGPPRPRELLLLRSAGTHLFVRAIHTSR